MVVSTRSASVVLLPQQDCNYKFLYVVRAPKSGRVPYFRVAGASHQCTLLDLIGVLRRSPLPFPGGGRGRNGACDCPAGIGDMVAVTRQRVLRHVVNASCGGRKTPDWSTHQHDEDSPPCKLLYRAMVRRRTSPPKIFPLLSCFLCFFLHHGFSELFWWSVPQFGCELALGVFCRLETTVAGLTVTCLVVLCPEVCPGVLFAVGGVAICVHLVFRIPRTCVCFMSDVQMMSLQDIFVQGFCFLQGTRV